MTDRKTELIKKLELKQILLEQREITIAGLQSNLRYWHTQQAKLIEEIAALEKELNAIRDERKEHP